MGIKELLIAKEELKKDIDIESKIKEVFTTEKHNKIINNTQNNIKRIFENMEV